METLIKVENLVKKFKDFTAVDGWSVLMDKGPARPDNIVKSIEKLI